MRGSVIKGNKLLFGGDYNPDQWKNYPEILSEDIRLMKLAGCNTMTVGIFSWAEIEPQEGIYNFEFMDSVINRLYENGIKVILATPSGARPAWLSRKYPEVLRTTERFEKKHHGERHNHCYTSPVYREKVRNINTKLAERYKDHPGLIMWHISNEYNGACYCEKCAEAFREWLKNKYKSLDALNAAWWNAFWSHTYSDWNEIEPPSPIGECSIHALKTDFKRFVTDSTIDFYLEEAKVLRKITPDIPVTTNWYWCQEELNYKKFSEYVDIVAWDEYPEWHSPKGDFNIANETAFIYNHNRSLKGGQPFMLMESTPSLVSYRTANGLKRPEMTLTSALQALAHGSDTVQYFQWRKSRGSFEKFHGAVVDHEGSENTRTFREVSALGKILNDISEIKNGRTKSEAAIMYDRENLWAIDECLGFKTHNMGYEKTCFAHHKCLYGNSINIDVIAPKDDYTKYKLIIVPMLYMMSNETVNKIEEYVRGGGTVVMTYISAYVNETDLCMLGGFPAGKLKEVFGIWNEEIDSLFDGVTKKVKAMDGKIYNAVDYCELLHTRGAEVIAEYDEDFYKGMPCVTKNRYGKGTAYYIGFRDEGDFIADFYNKLISEIGIERVMENLPDEIVAVSRENENGEYIFLQNFSNKTVEIESKYKNMLKRTNIKGNKIILSPYETAILKRNM